MLYAPELKAGNGPDSATYTLGKGEQSEAVLYCSSDIMYMGNADLFANSSEKTNGVSLAAVGAYNSTQLNGSGSGYYWGTCLRNQDGLNGTKVKSVVSVYEKPMSPLTIKDICYFGYTKKGVTPVPANKKLTATIVKLDNTGKLTTDTIAKASIMGSDLIIQNQEDVYIPFTFVEKDPATGRVAPVQIVIKDAFAIILDNFDDDDMDLGLLSDVENTIESTSYYTKVDALTGVSDGKLYKSANTGMNIYLTMNAYFNYLFVYPDSKVLNAPAAGGEAVDKDGQEGAIVASFFYDVQDSVTNEELIWLKNSLPDWLELSYTNEYYDDYGALIFLFNAKALPAGITERETDVVFSSPGAEASLKISQKATNGVIVDKEYAVSLVPNQQGYMVRYPSTIKNMQLHSLSGQFVSNYNLSQSGVYQLSTRDLKPGIYLLKINGVNKSFKIIK